MDKSETHDFIADSTHAIYYRLDRIAYPKYNMKQLMRYYI